MKKQQKGSFTIEASVIVPMILMVFVLIVYAVFYYHDKNILEGAAYETAVVGSGRSEPEEAEIRAYFRKRIQGKLILFGQVQEEISMDKEEVIVKCTAEKKKMRVSAEVSAKRTEPERFIRDIRKIQKTGEKLGETK